ncbi:MAG: cation transporter [Desulfovibrio sp.]|jgi:copper chaperone CopZ|nr:cation transporter [Desulfovibrio sp.]
MPTLRIDGMHCDHCKAAVEKAAATVPGVGRPVVDLGKGELRYEEDGTVDTKALAAAVNALGFTARP